VKGTLIIVFVAAMFLGCGGSAGTLPQDGAVYGFQASLDLPSATNVPGRRVSYTLQLLNTGNTAVTCDVIMRVVSDDGEELSSQKWQEVRIMPSEEWLLQNSFLPATDAQPSYKVSVEVRRHDTGELLYADPEVTRINFTRS
jgi:hypothetical protein